MNLKKKLSLTLATLALAATVSAGAAHMIDHSQDLSWLSTVARSQAS